MGWISYAIGTGDGDQLCTAAAEIIAQNLGACTYDNTTDCLTYVFNGTTYTVYTSGYSSNTTGILFMNTDTGEFCISSVGSAVPASALEKCMHAGIFRLQTGEDTIELVSLTARSFKKNAYEVFSIMCSSYANSDTFVTLVPVFGGYSYSNEYNPVGKHQFKLIVDMYTSHMSGIATGKTIQVAGQNFLCIMPTLFVKL